MKNVDILLQATKYSAEIAGIDDEVGFIGPEKKADWILIDGNPDEDISCMYHKPEKVWKDGSLVLAKIIHFSKYRLMILHDNILDIVHTKIPRDLARGIFCI